MLVRLLLVLSLVLGGYLVASILPLTDAIRAFMATSPPDVQVVDMAARVSSAGLTLVAIVLALVREEVRKIWDRPELRIAPRDQAVVTEVEASPVGNGEQQDDGGVKDDVQVDGYQVVLEVSNAGTAPARGCEVALVSLVHVNNIGVKSPVKMEQYSLSWIGTDDKRATIPPERKMQTQLLFVGAPEGKSGGAKTPYISIGKGFKRNEGGTWIAKIAVYSESSARANMEIEVKWSGKWAKRIPEMKSELSAKVLTVWNQLPLIGGK